MNKPKRKPSALKLSKGNTATAFNDKCGQDFSVAIELGDLKDAKRLIKWLQTCVAWLEQEA